jgi:hypothetical protein
VNTSRYVYVCMYIHTYTYIRKEWKGFVFEWKQNIEELGMGCTSVIKALRGWDKRNEFEATKAIPPSPPSSPKKKEI